MTDIAKLPVGALILVCLSAMATASSAKVPLAGSSQARARSGESYVVSPAPGDIVVRDLNGKVTFSAKVFAQSERVALAKLLGPDLKTIRHSFSVVSLAGPYLAIRDETEINTAEPLPGGSTRLWTIDLRRPATYRFDDAEPLRPMPGDATLLDLRQLYDLTVLGQVIGATRLGAPGPNSPTTRDLKYVLSDLSKRGQTSPACYGADLGVLSSFAIVGRLASKVDIQLGLSGQAACRYALTPLIIAAPVNDRTRDIPVAKSFVIKSAPVIIDTNSDQ
ncbi:hypothetical protein [Polymorphobacter megasporae]|uniref:hypothetical protein n=1 Tax=Glacieibacterium megasporae TaxID=2835787 RepID=UPI001C1E8B24|nr:hypothetical protein [Polymorphobacter megasporae]UAJ12407.1 hypothetical protein KTC28_21605 [Polymorphobacter megasporae]